MTILTINVTSNNNIMKSGFKIPFQNVKATWLNSLKLNLTISFYVCSTYSLSKGVFTDKCSQHYIRTKVVRELVLDAIKSISGYVRENEAEFVARVRESSAIRADETAKASRRKLAQNQKRITELDRLLRKLTRTTRTEN